MRFFSSPPRQAETTIPCEICKKALIAKRTCHEAYLECTKCKKAYSIGKYASQMDTALEKFLNTLNSDRA